MYQDKAAQFGGTSYPVGQPSPLTQSTPVKPTRSLIESRNSLCDGLDHLMSSIKLLDSLLDTLRPCPQANATVDKEPMPSGQIQTSLDYTADLYSIQLNRLRRRVEELDSILGAGFASAAAEPRRG